MNLGMKSVAAVALIVSCFASSSFAQEQQNLGAKLILRDTKHILTAPVRWDKKDWTYFTFATIGILGTMAYADKPVFVDIQETREDGRADAFNFVEPFGFQYAYGILGGFYFVGSVFDKPRERMVARDGVATALISLGVVEGIKAVTGRSRPRSRAGAFEFEPFSGNKSFPSGHAATSFGLATVVSSYYHPLWLKLSAFGIAGLVGLSRIDHNAHFVSDVVAGASIGAAIGHSVVKFNHPENGTQHAKWILLPYYNNQEKGISMTVLF